MIANREPVGCEKVNIDTLNKTLFLRVCIKYPNQVKWVNDKIPVVFVLASVTYHMKVV